MPAPRNLPLDLRNNEDLLEFALELQQGHHVRLRQQSLVLRPMTSRELA